MMWRCRRGPSRLVWLCAVLMISAGVNGCHTSSKAQSAIILHVEWEKTQEILSVQLFPQADQVEVTALLEGGEEVRARMPISTDQSRMLRDGARLLVRTAEGKYHEALVTIVPD